MKQLILYTIFLVACFCSGTSAYSQKKLLILGSSTSSCYNISFDSCYVGRIQRYYQLAGTPIVIDNRAVAGDNCYHGMPAGYTPPLGRNAPRPYNNITEGLQGNPDIVLVNYPSNGYDVYSVAEIMFCLRTIKQAANNAGKPCYVTTSQPRSEPASYQTPEVRQKMQTIRDSVLSAFGQYAINFWDDLVNPANNFLQDRYNSGDGTHLTGAGHAVLFNRVTAKNIFNPQQGGLTYRYYEGNWNTLPDFNTLTPVKTGSAVNIDLSAKNVNDYFGFVWEGTINITTPGTYTFETVSDDGSKFYFNTNYSAGANALVNNDGTHGPVSAYGSVNIPAAGRYPVAITFFEKTAGEVMQLYWSGPGIQRQLVPDNAFNGTPLPASGLAYSYYEGSWPTLPDFSTLTALKTGTSSNLDLGIRSRDIYYAIQWQGSITIPASGNYSFETVSDDGSLLYIGSNLVVNNDGQHGVQTRSGSLALAAGVYPVRIAFMNACCDAVMQLYWSGPGIQRQLVPDNAFTGTAPVSASGLNYKYYEGEFNALPDFNALTPLKTGASANLDLNVRTAGVNDRYAFLWSGSINLPVSGTYTFETISDDGSRVYFDVPYSAGAAGLVNNDGLHGPQQATGTVTAAAGKHPITITYFEKDGGETMQLYWTGPGISRQIVPNEAFSITSATASTTAASRLQNASAGEAKKPATNVGVYPNPFAQSFTLDYYHDPHAGNKAILSIYDMKGRQVVTWQPSAINTGLNRWTIAADDKTFAPGVYTGQLYINGRVVKTVKLVKMK